MPPVGCPVVEMFSGLRAVKSAADAAAGRIAENAAARQGVSLATEQLQAKSRRRPARRKRRPMHRVLFVCTGNICRSPTAEGIFRHMVRDAGLAHLIETDSAGTHGYHVGEAPDARSQAAARLRGYDLSALRARKVEAVDFTNFDLLIAMDRGHQALLTRMASAQGAHKVRLMMSYASGSGYDEVPDPYYGGPDGFELVLDLLEESARGLLAAVARQLR
jgi:protein-tyrosine phosphatase